MLATRLADRGLLEKSLSYLEKLSTYIVRHSTTVEMKFVESVYNLADKLKYYDPVGDAEDETEFGGMSETSRAENTWLIDLRAVLNDPNARFVQQQDNNEPAVANTVNNEYYSGGGQDDAWQQQQSQTYQQNYPQWQPEVQQTEYQQPLQQQNGKKCQRI